jgi:hypothetical protein
VGARMNGPMAYNKLPLFKSKSKDFLFFIMNYKDFPLGFWAYFPFNLKPI